MPLILLHLGILTDPVAPSSFGAWIKHASTHHIGAISFLIVDFFLFFGVAVLTIIQASQVCAMFRKSLYFLVILLDW